MSTFVPIPRNGLRKPVEMSGMTSSRESASVQRSWRTLLEAQENVAAGHNSQSILAGKLRTIQPSNPSLMYPFKIYQLPWQFRTATNPATDWLKVRVRTGRILQGGIEIVKGTDGAPQPDIETYNDLPKTYYDISVPANTSKYYIWVKISTFQLYFGTSPASGNIPTTSSPWFVASADSWPTFPNTDSDHVLIGYCDSNTMASQHLLLVTQYVRADLTVFFSNSGATTPSLNSVAIGFAIGYDNTTLIVYGGFSQASGYLRCGMAGYSSGGILTPLSVYLAGNDISSSWQLGACQVVQCDRQVGTLFLAFSPQVGSGGTYESNPNDGTSTSGPANPCNPVGKTDFNGNPDSTWASSIQTLAMPFANFGVGAALIQSPLSGHPGKLIMIPNNTSQVTWGASGIGPMFSVNSDTSIDEVFPFQNHAGTALGPASISGLTAQANYFKPLIAGNNGNIWCLGDFQASATRYKYNGTLIPSRYFCVLDRTYSIITSFSDSGTAFNQMPAGFTVALDGSYNDSQYYFCGQGLTYNGSTLEIHVLRFSTSGILDTTFQCAISSFSAGSGEIYGIIQQGSDILVFGSFSTINGSGAGGIIRLNSTGGIDSSFSGPTSISASGYINCAIIHPLTGDIWVGGSFTTLNGSARNNIARLNSSGALQ